MKRIDGFQVRRGALMCLAAMLLAIGSLAACSGNDGTPGTDAWQDANDVPDIGTDSNDSPDVERPDTTEDAESLDVAVDPTALELVAMGKDRLSAGESLAAMDAFDRALEHAPGLQEAQWGLVLARLQSNVAMFGSLIGLIQSEVDPDAPVVMTLRSLAWPDHDGTVGVIVDGLYRSAMAQKARLDELKTTKSNGVFSLPDGLPLEMGDYPMMRLCCEWDQSDAYGISSFNNLLLALTAFLGSQEADVSFDRIMHLFRENSGIANALIRVLDDYPDMLTLLPETGEESWRATGDFVAAAARDALESARLMALDDGAGDPVATLADDGTAYLLLHGDFPGDRMELAVLWEGSDASLKATVEKVVAHLDGTPDSRLSLDADVLVAIGVLVDIINRTVGFEAVLAGLGVDLPDIVITLLAGLDPEDPDQLVGLLGMVLPMIGIKAGTVELDLATFFDTPFNLRDLFPVTGPEPGTPNATFLRSFECARGGATVVENEASQTVTFFVHDPSADAPEITLSVEAHAMQMNLTFDLESVTLVAVDGFTGLYSGQLEMVFDAGEGTTDDGVLQTNGDVYVSTTYTSTDHPEGTVVISGTQENGFTKWDYGASCVDDSKPWDAPHFGQVEFADAVEITAPGQSRPMPEIPADGVASRSGILAFPSPSFDGLIWLDGDGGLAVADQATFSALIGGVMAAVEAF